MGRTWKETREKKKEISGLICIKEIYVARIRYSSSGKGGIIVWD